MDRQYKHNTHAHTPWGPSQTEKQVAEGITLHSTAGHGGYLISDERRQQMPEPLRSWQTYAGGNWYEEDCDWAVVVIAFPDDFPPRDVWAAVRMINSPMVGSHYGPIADWLTSDHAALHVLEIATDWLQEHADEYLPGSSSGTPEGITQHWHQIGDHAKTLTTQHQSYMDIPMGPVSREALDPYVVGD